MKPMMQTGTALMLMLGAPAAALAAEADGGGGLLDPGGWGAVWNLLLFLILVLILAKFVWPPILAGLQAREEKIRGDIVGAEQANRQAQQTLADYKKQLAEAHGEARRLIEQARSDAEAVRGRMLAEAEQEMLQVRQRVTADIEQAKQKAVQELYDHSARLSVAVAEKILQRQIQPEDTERLIDQSLAELEKLEQPA